MLQSNHEMLQSKQTMLQSNHSKLKGQEKCIELRSKYGYIFDN